LRDRSRIASAILLCPQLTRTAGQIKNCFSNFALSSINLKPCGIDQELLQQFSPQLTEMCGTDQEFHPQFCSCPID
jgi:hypothetical protein